MFDFFKEHSGEIAVTLGVVAVLPGAVVFVHVSAGVAIAATCVSGVSGCVSLFSGGYYLGRRDEAAKEQERNHSKQEAENTQRMEVTRDKKTTLAQEHNLVNGEEHKLNTKLNQHDLRITSLTNRQDAAEATRAKDRINSERQHNEHERRLLEIEGHLANGFFTNNPGNNIRHRSAAVNDDNEDGHRGRHRRQRPGQI